MFRAISRFAHLSIYIIRIPVNQPHNLDSSTSPQRIVAPVLSALTTPKLPRAFDREGFRLNIGQIATIKPFARFALPCDFKHVAGRGAPEIAGGRNKGQVCPSSCIDIKSWPFVSEQAHDTTLTKFRKSRCHRKKSRGHNC